MVLLLQYCIGLKFGGAKLWQINLHGNFGRLNFGEMSTMIIIVHNLEGYLVIER